MWGSGLAALLLPGVLAGLPRPGRRRRQQALAPARRRSSATSSSVAFAGVLPRRAAAGLGPDLRTRLFWTLYAVGDRADRRRGVPRRQRRAGVLRLPRGADRRRPRAVAIPVVGVLIVGVRARAAVRPGLGRRRSTGTSALTVFLVPFAMFGFFMIIRSNIALTAARAEVARLAAENERTRIARDLHDLLGHSLTTITVKAGLARRLAERGDPERAADEIAEVEQLSRRTLGDVRAAVAGLPRGDAGRRAGDARARCCARPASTAELPGAIDAVDADAVELFGWVVREAVTNVVRHSRADALHDHASGRAGSRSSTTAAARGRARRRATGWPACASGSAHVGGTVTGAARRRRAATLRAELPRPVHRLERADASMPESSARSGCCSPTTRRSSGPRWPRCSSSRTTSRSSPRSGAATRWSPRRSRARPDVALLDIEMPGLDGLAAAAALHHAAAGLPGDHPDHVRPARLPAPGDGVRRARLRRQGHRARAARRRGAPGAPRRAGRRPGARRGDAGRRRVAADRPRARRARRRARRRDGRRHRRQAVPVRGHGAQLPVRGDRQDRHAQPGRGDARRRPAGWL